MAGKRVLVVDDDVKTVELVKLYLNRDGYRVLAAYGHKILDVTGFYDLSGLASSAMRNSS